MGTRVIILPEVRAAHDARLGNRMERIQIQTFVAHRPVESLFVAVLPRAARITIQRRSLVQGQPALHGQCHEFWPIIAAQERRSAALIA